MMKPHLMIRYKQYCPSTEWTEILRPKIVVPIFVKIDPSTWSAIQVTHIHTPQRRKILSIHIMITHTHTNRDVTIVRFKFI